MQDQNDKRKGRSDALISAVIEHWCVSSDSALSVRNLTASIGAAASAIDYHFGGLEQLYVEASKQSLEEATLWMESVLHECAALRDRSITTAVRSAVIDATLEDWTRHRALAMAWRRTKALSETSESSALRAAWDEAWAGFWSGLADCIGMQGYAATLAAFADGEACRHLLGWRPVLDASLLFETAHALVAWLDAGLIAEDAMRMAYRSSVATNFPGLNSESGRAPSRLEFAAADLLARNGRSSVTFRAVANEAGSTLGTVSHHFGSKSNLLRSALDTLYEREAMRGDRDALFQLTIAPAPLLEQMIEAFSLGEHPMLVAYDEIELAIYNDSDFTDLRAAVRCMDDPTGAWVLKNLLGERQPSQSLVAAFSSVCRGAGHFATTGASRPADSRASMRSALAPFCVG